MVFKNATYLNNGNIQDVCKTTRKDILKVCNQKKDSANMLCKMARRLSKFIKAGDVWPNIFKLRFKRDNIARFSYIIISKTTTCWTILSEFNLTKSPKCRICNEIDINISFYSVQMFTSFKILFLWWWKIMSVIVIPAVDEYLEECIIFDFYLKEGLEIFEILNFCSQNTK